MNSLSISHHNYREMWPMGLWSALFHLLGFVFLVNFQLPASNTELPVCYVDLLNLPVAQPAAGVPAVEPAAPPEPAAASPREMALPAKPVVQVQAQPSVEPPRKQAEAADNAQEFEERMARLEREAEARHAAAALEAIRKKGGSGTAGIPGATGSEAGSEYVAYVQSRLKDAFKTTIAFQAKNPEVALRVTISRTGRFSRIKTERSTGDKVFEDAVARAVAKAENTIPAPPRGEEIDTGFVFRPQGIVIK